MDRSHRRRRILRLPARQHRLNGACEILEVRLQRGCQRIEPVNVADEIFERSARCNVFNPQRENRYATVDGPLDFAANLMRVIRMGGEDENHDPGLLNGFDDALAPFHAGSDIPRGNPAADAIRFEDGADRVGGRFVFDGVADENVVSHVNRALICYSQERRDFITKFAKERFLNGLDDHSQRRISAPAASRMPAKRCLNEDASWQNHILVLASHLDAEGSAFWKSRVSAPRHGPLPNQESRRGDH